MNEPDSIVVSVPARSEFLHILRTVVAAVAARGDFPYDAIDDLKISVDEACTNLLRAAAAGPATTLNLRIQAVEGQVDVVAWTDAEGPTWPPPGAERSLTWQVLAALTEETRFEQVDGHPGVRFSKRAMGS